MYYVHSSASPADVERDDHPDRAQDSEGDVDGHLGSAKAAGETDTEYVLRAGRYDIRKDEEWRENTSAETEAANFELAVQWDKEDATGGSRRGRSQRRKGPRKK